jgi:protein-S-isoprenylcysteine O-methyltransferase Ste14
MTFLLLFLQVILYAGFIFSASRYFRKKDVPGSHPKQLAIQILGLLQIINALFISFYSPSQEFQIPALLLFLTATVFFYWTFFTVTRRTRLNFAFSESSPQLILQEGPYRYVRHPFYFSYICAWVGVFLYTEWSPISIVAGLALTFLYVLAARQEEQEFLRSPLHETYAAYQGKTVMLIPFVF